MTMKAWLLAAALLTAGAGAGWAQNAPATAVAPGYSVANTTIGVMMDTPVLRALLDKDVPGVSTHPQVDDGRGMTLPEAEQYAPDIITTDRMAALDADLKALPVPATPAP